MSRKIGQPAAPTLFTDISSFPSTRYQGSKRKLAGAIMRRLAPLEYESVLDAFGGTGAMAYSFKCEGKQVTYNDILAFNEQIGLALIANSDTRLEPRDVDWTVTRHGDIAYADFIERTFHDIYFTDEENQWLDVAVQNIRLMEDERKRAIAWFALFQSAMAKRPYNLFHRRNLYMRTAEIERGFGNKASWDRPFPEHFARFVEEANTAVVDTGVECRVLRWDVLEIEPDYDLVYIDPPYINASGVGVDYRNFYHFLEGMMQYDKWTERIDWESKHRRLLAAGSPWTDPSRSLASFAQLFDHFRESVLAVSYRSDGTPTIDELETQLRMVKSHVQIHDLDEYQYVLSTKRRSREVLLIGW